MTRLGLSDSMRSTASQGKTAPLHAASHRRYPRQRLAAATGLIAKSFTEKERKPKPTSFVLSNSLRVILRSVLAILLLLAGAKMITSLLSFWRNSTLQVEEQFEQLEKSISLLDRDTVRLKTTADRFLQRCQQTHVVASTRTEMLQNAAQRGFEEQVKAQTEEHAQVMRKMVQYYAEQEQRVQKTRERLIMMNISLPVHIAVRPVHEILKDEQEGIEDLEKLLKRNDTRGLFGTMKEAAFFTKKTQQQDSGVCQRLSVKSIADGHWENLQRTRVEQLTSHRTIFFYVSLICASAVYLWNAISDARKKELLDDKWLWSPVPKALSRLKILLGSFLVIEDLRRSRKEEVS